MKKENFVSLILGTIGVMFFALGMCMCLISEWNAFQQGIITGAIGLVVLFIMLIVRRKMQGKNRNPIKHKDNRYHCFRYRWCISIRRWNVYDYGMAKLTDTWYCRWNNWYCPVALPYSFMQGIEIIGGFV